MKYIIIVLQILVLYLFSTLGDIISTVLKLPLPGSIIGLLLLFICLYFKIIPALYIKNGAVFLLALLPLFFIPATVGVIQYPELLSGKGMLLVLLVIVSTLMTILVTGRVSEMYEEKLAGKGV